MGHLPSLHPSPASVRSMETYQNASWRFHKPSKCSQKIDSFCDDSSKRAAFGLKYINHFGCFSEYMSRSAESECDPSFNCG